MKEQVLVGLEDIPIDMLTDEELCLLCGDLREQADAEISQLIQEAIDAAA